MSATTIIIMGQIIVPNIYITIRIKHLTKAITKAITFFVLTTLKQNN